MDMGVTKKSNIYIPQKTLFSDISRNWLIFWMDIFRISIVENPSQQILIPNADHIKQNTGNN